MGSKLLIDVDTGVDDAHALILALSQPDVEVLAVTCVHGNVDVDKVCNNTLRVLKVCGKLDVPVYKGADKPILGIPMDASYYHGKDGLGNASDMVDVDDAKIQTEHAVLAMLRLVNQYPGEITLVALAPLTNVALAIRLDPDFGKKLKQFTLMGGNIEAKGRVSICAEFNFFSDPEAASIVLCEMKSVNILPYEVCLNQGLQWEWLDSWFSTDSSKGKFVHGITQRSAHLQRDVHKIPLFLSCDLFTMATVIEPDIILDTETVHAVVELHGQVTRGQMVVDWRGQLGHQPNVTLIKKINFARAQIFFDKMLL